MNAYDGMEPYVFISYSHRDSNAVVPLIQNLQNRNFRVWYDDGVEVGSEWPDYIADRLERCSCVLAFVSRNYGESNNCREELTFAKELRKEIVVIHLEDRMKLRAGMRMQLVNLHALFYEQYENAQQFLDKLSEAEVLKNCRPKQGAPERKTAPAPETGAQAEEWWRLAQIYWEQKAYEQAAGLYRKAADLGYAKAQNSLGICYFNGQGVEMNRREAVYWYRKAAEQGYSYAQSNLGGCYYNGDGVVKDYEEALKWYRRAAEQGNMAAQYNMGNAYDDGNGVPKNFAEAARWYRMAADQGDAFAQNNLGNLYFFGKGVPKNYEEAVKWYRKAAEKGRPSAQYNLGLRYYHGQGVPQNREEAIKWVRMAADQGFADAKTWLTSLK